MSDQDLYAIADAIRSAFPGRRFDVGDWTVEIARLMLDRPELFMELIQGLDN